MQAERWFTIKWASPAKPRSDKRLINWIGEIEIMSISLEDLYPILFVLVWFVAMRYVLPRLGVRT
jgi:hypothetical protein